MKDPMHYAAFGADGRKAPNPAAEKSADKSAARADKSAAQADKANRQADPANDGRSRVSDGDVGKDLDHVFNP